MSAPKVDVDVREGVVDGKRQVRVRVVWHGRQNVELPPAYALALSEALAKAAVWAKTQEACYREDGVEVEP